MLQSSFPPVYPHSCLHFKGSRRLLQSTHTELLPSMAPVLPPMFLSLNASFGIDSIQFILFHHIQMKELKSKCQEYNVNPVRIPEKLYFNTQFPVKFNLGGTDLTIFIKKCDFSNCVVVTMMMMIW